MAGTLVFFLALILCFSYLKERDILNPSVLISAHWLFFVSGYLIIEHGMYPLSSNVLVILLLWIFSFITGYYLFRKISFRGQNQYPEVNEGIRKLYFIICLLGLPFLLLKLFLFGLSVGFSNFFPLLRLAVVGLSDDIIDFGILKYLTSLALISLLVEIYEYKPGDSKKRILILSMINIVCSLSTVSKISIFSTLIPIIAVLYSRKLVKKRYIAALFALVIIGLSLFTILRSGDEGDGQTIINVFNVYFFGGLPAFDQVQATHSMFSYSGVNLFPSLFKVLNALGANFDVSNDTGYVFVPYPTNVYTVLFPYWEDFGYFGIIFGGGVLGCINAIIYRLHKKGFGWATVLYSTFVAAILLQFFSDITFVMLSQTIQYIALAYLAYSPISFRR